MIKKILNKIRKLRSYKKQLYKIHKKGTLLNSFYESKIIFIHIPKTAGVSFLKSMFGDVTLEGHRSVSFYKKIFKNTYSDFLTFTIVRNPWDRLYSSYKFLQKGGINIHDKNAFQTHLCNYRDFEDFVINGLDQKIIWKIVHFIPQYNFICDENDKILVDYVGKFENLKKSVEEINDIFKLDFELEHHNKNYKKNFKDIYTPEMIEKVSQIYQKDIDIFEYSFS